MCSGHSTVISIISERAQLLFTFLSPTHKVHPQGDPHNVPLLYGLKDTALPRVRGFYAFLLWNYRESGKQNVPIVKEHVLMSSLRKYFFIRGKKTNIKMYFQQLNIWDAKLL